MKCAVCDHDQFRETALLPGLAVARCQGCGFLVSRIEGAQRPDEGFSRTDDTRYERAIGLLRQHQATEVLALVRPHARAGGDWLDIGCSFGYLLERVREAGFRIFGIEPDEKAFPRAREKLGADHVQFGTMTDTSRPDASADVVSMLDVLEHIPAAELPDFARMIHRKLRPDGLWVLKVPATEGLYFTLAHRLLPVARPPVAGVIRRLWQSDYRYPHTVYFSRETLARFLDRHGFDVVASDYLAEVPSRTVLDRLLLDDTIPRWQALLIAPALYVINAVEAARGKSDALVMVARRRG